MAAQGSFKKGDKVVYPSHGVGEIIGEETQVVAGSEMKFYIISYEKDKMLMKVPVNSKKSGLRVLSKELDIDKAVKTLKGRAKQGRGMWSRRAKEFEEKINSGNIVLIAEVVRDLHKNVDDPDRSYSERVIYEAALNRLAGEYAAVKIVAADEATTKLVNVLKSRKKKAADNDDIEESSNDNSEAA